VIFSLHANQSVYLAFSFLAPCMLPVRMCGSVIEYHTRICKEVTTEDEIGRNQDDGAISRISLTFTLSG
jgi:hypothetical protein